MPFSVSDVLVCTFAKDTNLTKDKEYVAVGSHDWQVAVINDKNSPQFYDNGRFKLKIAAQTVDQYKASVSIAVSALRMLVEQVKLGPVSIEQITKAEQAADFAAK